jgi:hypothetical protein
MAIKLQNGSKMDQMDMKRTNIWHCKALQNLPKLGFLVWKFAIWQPCSAKGKKVSLRVRCTELGKKTRLTMPRFDRLLFRFWRRHSKSSVVPLAAVTNALSLLLHNSFFGSPDLEPILRSWVTMPALYVIYNDASNLVHFENKSSFFYIEKML